MTTLIDWIAANRLEATATALGLINQWLTIRQNIWCWPVGIASVALFALVFFEAKLYSDVLLQVFYVALQAYGWHHWLYGAATRNALRPRALAVRQYWHVLLLVVVVAGVLGTVMRTLTDASLPFLDATATGMSLVAQWLQARKLIESWLLFLVANALFIGIYAAKGLYITIVLYCVISVMAVAGFVAWRRAYRTTGPR